MPQDLSCPSAPKRADPAPSTDSGASKCYITDAWIFIIVPKYFHCRWPPLSSSLSPLSLIRFLPVVTLSWQCPSNSFQPYVYICALKSALLARSFLVVAATTKHAFHSYIRPWKDTLGLPENSVRLFRGTYGFRCNDASLLRDGIAQIQNIGRCCRDSDGMSAKGWTLSPAIRTRLSVISNCTSLTTCPVALRPPPLLLLQWRNTTKDKSRQPYCHVRDWKQAFVSIGQQLVLAFAGLQPSFPLMTPQHCSLGPSGPS